MTTRSEYGTRIEGERAVCQCPDVRYRRGGSYQAIDPETGEVVGCCKHAGMIYRAYGWVVTKREMTKPPA